MKTRLPKIYWHRGYHKHLPENSQKAIHQAVSKKPGHCEIDIVMTSDGQALINHDWYLKTDNQSNININEVNWSQIKQLKQHPPQFFEVLKSLPNNNLHEHFLIELKKPPVGLSMAYYSKFAADLTQFKKTPWLFNSFDLDILRFMHSQNPQFRFILNIECQKKYTEVQSIAKNTPWLEGFCIDINIATKKVESISKKIGFFTCNSEEEINKCLRLNADFIVSDNASFALEAVSKEL